MQIYIIFTKRQKGLFINLIFFINNPGRLICKTLTDILLLNYDRINIFHQLIAQTNKSSKPCQ